MSITYTPEQIEEIKKCETDPLYFIKTYGYVQHPIIGKLWYTPGYFNKVDLWHETKTTD